MDKAFEKVRVSKPIVISQAGAHQQLMTWIHQNDYMKVPDLAGVEWRLNIKHFEELDVLGKELQLPADVRFEATLGSEQLINTKVLDVHKDSRLIQLLGDRKVPMVVKQKRLVSSGLDTLKVNFIRYISLTTNYLKKLDGVEVKRMLVFKYIDDTRNFGR